VSWHGILGHDAIVERFRRALTQGRLASTFLFVGPGGVGKRTFARKLAQAMLCTARPEQLLDPCGHCPACAQAAAGTHPDLELVSRPGDKSVLPVEKFIGPPERRMQEGLCHNIALKPFMGGRKIAIVDDADFLGEEGANALLKTLEEPPPRSVLILVGTSADKQLPTIRSRCQIIRFQPLPRDTVVELLVSSGQVGDREEARRIAAYCEGSLERAAELADDALWEFRRRFLNELAKRPLDNVGLAPTIVAFVEEAGKEAAVRRARLRQVIGFACEFYRVLLRSLAGGGKSDDAELNSLTRQAATGWRGGEESAAACVARCLDALEQIDRNVHQATLVECWLDDLSNIVASGCVLAV
jgi:DNA polymerase III subunit delta'